MTAEARDVPFRFTRPYAYAYEGVNVVRYQPGDALVSAGCARAATADKAGSLLPAPKEPTKAEVEAAKRKADADAKASAIEAQEAEKRAKAEADKKAKADAEAGA